MALSNQTADVATLEVDPCIKTAPDNTNIFIEPLYLDERAGCTLTVKGANLLKQFIAAGILAYPVFACANICHFLNEVGPAIVGNGDAGRVQFDGELGNAATVMHLSAE